MVWVRVAQAAAGGSFTTARPIDWPLPRSTVSVCGKALLELSQYVVALPSTAFPAGNPLAELPAVTGRDAARLPLVGGAVVGGGVVGGTVGVDVGSPYGGVLGPLPYTGVG